jgi:outer membrane protein OmpA-like peptidoglycan-associated protein
MKSLGRYLSLVLCTLALFTLAGCSRWSAAHSEAAVTPAPPRASAPEPAKLTPLPASTADERLASALDHLGAQHGMRGEILTLSDTTFAAGKATFKAGKENDLDQVVTLLRDYPKADLIIDGYTDNRGSEHLNDRLSLERAEAVRHALVARGVDEKRIRARGLGSASPVADNHTRKGREENRRVELVFSDSEGRFASTSDRTASG